MSWMLLALIGCGDSEQADGEAPAPEAEATPAPDAAEARVFFVEPADGATVSSPVKIKMGIEGMAVKPAGDIADNSGHHHIVINGSGIEEGSPVPANETHIHFGKGQTEAEVELPAGEHTLTLQFADGGHLSYGEKLTSTIKVTVQ